MSISTLPIIFTAKQQMRLWDRILVQDDDQCWPYLGRLSEDGYGQIDIKNHQYLAHRMVFTIKYGPTDDLICHTCDNPSCCNPKHLFAGSSGDNVMDSVKKGRHSSVTLLGEARPNAKLTEEKVKEIRFKYELGFTQTALGKEYNMHYSTISQIVTYKTWKHI